MMTFEVYYKSCMSHATMTYAGKLHIAEHCHVFINKHDRRMAGSTTTIPLVRSLPCLHLKRINTPQHLKRNTF